MIRYAIRAVCNQDGTYTLKREEGHGMTPTPPATMQPDKPGSRDEVYLVNSETVPVFPSGKLTAEQKDEWLRNFGESLTRGTANQSMERVQFSQ